MLNRRRFLAVASAAAGAAIVNKSVPAAAQSPVSAASSSEDLVRYVNVFIGTGGHGHCFPGATVPFGAVQFSPDTGIRDWDWSSGYHHDDTTLMGFSHTHLSGTGVGDMLDLLLVPRTGNVVLEPGTDPEARKNPEGTYRSHFSHDDEHGEAGYYSVLTRSSGGNKIKTELTATERTGLARFTFPTGEPAHILLDWHHVYGTESEVKSAELSVVSDTLVMGGRRVNKWAPDREIYFATEFSSKPSKVEVFVDDKPSDDRSVDGRNLKVAFHFEPGSTVLVKSGISMVSASNALGNLRKEQPGFDFEAIRAAARRMWQHELSRIRVEDPSEERKTIFYSSLYHMMCAPTLADDCNGQYRGLDKQIHQLAAGEHNYSTYSLWDTYRALHPSFTLWQRDRVPRLVNCLIRMGEESIYGFPIWPLQDGETYCMPGYHAASVMAEACVKKIPGIDWKRAYATMRKRNMDDDYMGLPDYRRMGYIPADSGGESIGKLVEYVYCDWACSHVADATGHPQDGEIQRRRSQNYKNVFDKQTQFIRPKLASGEWIPNFDPKATGHIPHHRDYTEANAWQSTFFIQHDVKGYMHLFGGREPFAAKLDRLFTEQPGVTNEVVADMTGNIGQYVHGNEPSHHITYLYAWAGQPWKTQERVREILLTHYRNDYDGLDGNEDCGQMSAWFVMSAMGLYAVDPVSATYVLSAPLFQRVTLALGDGRELVIEAKSSGGNREQDKYIQSVALNGKAHDRLWVRHDDLANGAHLVFTLGSTPNKLLGADEAAMPPSLTV
ncbi:GH92 family glycosyl hydrolase [Occallatibacter riparius]|uniref:GH92 family glycosyl hydrolase n=1 Tax=Occallatibacter riparius TaxID=1002689 RepID=A0A9J7BYW2_9BACT|nr:GH92 family glycosyl hydrolase [Occallatibacter riparius]UWZ86813.1 GH92 family glycosyl hydrolase [Occallatibacter riparius]